MQIPRTVRRGRLVGPLCLQMCIHGSCLSHICLQLFPGFPRTPSHQASGSQLTSQLQGVLTWEDLSSGLPSTCHTCLCPLPCLLPLPPDGVLLGSSKFFPFLPRVAELPAPTITPFSPEKSSKGPRRHSTEQGAFFSLGISLVL